LILIFSLSFDPAEWVGRGYAIVNVDSRGANDSEGNLRWWGSSEGKDGYDFIEGLAVKSWCNGNVGLAGNSWLAVSQYFIAAQQPPHLKCIAPLEGLSDVLRQSLARGGIAALGFPQMIRGILQGPLARHAHERGERTRFFAFC